MTKLAATLSISLAFAVVAVGCGGGDDNGGGGGSSKSTTPSSGVSSTKPQSVVMKNIQFDPKKLTVPPGATVKWTNEDIASHDVTGSGFKSGASGGLNTGDTYSHTFNRMGTFKYRCTIHPGMEGTVVVK
jgi:plastocyanin